MSVKIWSKCGATQVGTDTDIDIASTDIDTDTDTDTDTLKRGSTPVPES